MKRELTFKNEEQELNRVAEFMETVCDELQLDMNWRRRSRLCSTCSTWPGRSA